MPAVGLCTLCSLSGTAGALLPLPPFVTYPPSYPLSLSPVLLPVPLATDILAASVL